MDYVQIRPRYINKLEQVTPLGEGERQALQPVAEKFAFRTNEYYQSLNDWSDPADPTRRIVMPDVQELREFGEMDASDESSYTVLKGLEHKYRDTALLLVNNVCGAYCRFCFRKRLFTDDNDEVTSDVTEAVKYIAAHPEINNVLLSGGDPLIMSTPKLERIIRRLREIDHVRIIRIGSKMPAFDLYRVINDPALPDMLGRYSLDDRRIYLMCHFNDRPEVITELFSKLSYNGVPPYYIFLCRPTAGNEPYVVPVEEALSIFEESRRGLAGLAKHARLCMSHKSGKIEVVAKMHGKVIFRYHRAPDPLDNGRVVVCDSDPSAGWFDDYVKSEPDPIINLKLEFEPETLPL